jgi:hypothetical protein
MNRVFLSGDARRLPVRAAGPPVQPRFHAANAERLERRSLLSVFTVTTTADSGSGSLRQAILDANAAAGADEVRFDIPGTGVQTIPPISALPVVSGPLTIDGTTQRGYAGSPVIEISGVAAGQANGLVIGARPSVVKGLAINRFALDGVVFATDADPSGSATSSTLDSCFVGTTANGIGAAGNGGAGVTVITSSVFITGTAPGRSVISANASHGVHVVGGIASVRNSYIGTDAAGLTRLGNGGHGVFFERSFGTIGRDSFASSAGNLISGNRGHGVLVLGTPALSGFPVAVDVRGNRIGTDALGDYADATLGNGGHGVAIINVVRAAVGGEDDRAPNTIAFNGGSGVFVSGSDPSSRTDPTAVRILRNSIFSNARLGIDLAAPNDAATVTGVTPNDPRDVDQGPNGLLNYPVILSAVTRPEAGTYVRFALDVPRSATYRVEFFASPAADPSGFGEGATYVGFTMVDVPAGTAPFTAAATLAAAPVGTFVTATVTNLSTRITSEFSAAVPVTPFQPAQVVARYATSNGIVTDKQANLTGESGSFANVLTSARGIDGVVLDVTHLAQPEALTLADFAFRRTLVAPPGWARYPAHAVVGVSPGPGGTDRITVRFLDNFIHNSWLETTIKANERTGLERPDVFYFGNLQGETGDAASPMRVTAIDVAAVRRAMDGPTPPRGSPYDFNRDGVVNAIDLSVVRFSVGLSLPPLEASPAASFLLTVLASG